MENVILRFEERVEELEAYLRFLIAIEQPATRFYKAGVARGRAAGIDQTCIKVMRATAFLMIYNVVESAIRSAFEALYERIALEKQTIDTVTEDVRKLWIGQRHRAKNKTSASADTYRKLVEEVVDHILAKAVLELDVKQLSIAGSLDANAIRHVCELHGIPKLRVHHRAGGGAELVTVKQQRNALAHGNISFSECGQQYTAKDLKRIKGQAVVFVRSVLRNIKRYEDQQEYVA